MQSGKITHSDRRSSSRPIALIGLFGIGISVLLAPPVFSATLAMSPLLQSELLALWSFSVLLCAVSVGLVAGRSHVPPGAAAFVFGCLLVVTLELGARSFVNAFATTETRDHLSWLANRTYPEFMIIRGHPFLHYAGNRGTNDLGFYGRRDVERRKPPGVVRIACLGGSTTAGKWPGGLEYDLNELRTPEMAHFEVLDFGQNGYSSAHVLVNFFLNVVEHDPDYVVLHVGWNDAVIRAHGGRAKTDYSNVFRPFTYPAIHDKWLVRTSVIYRYLLFRPGTVPKWADFRDALDIDPGTRNYDDPSELRAFRGNLEKILDFSADTGIRVVLATQPHSTRTNVPNAEDAFHLAQTNEILRALHREHPQSTLLVDLDKKMTGHYDVHFYDLAHMDPEGNRVKAESIAAAIFADVVAHPVAP